MRTNINVAQGARCVSTFSAGSSNVEQDGESAENKHCHWHQMPG
jgi:hypothetical protein